MAKHAATGDTMATNSTPDPDTDTPAEPVDTAPAEGEVSTDAPTDADQSGAAAAADEPEPEVVPEDESGSEDVGPTQEPERVDPPQDQLVGTGVIENAWPEGRPEVILSDVPDQDDDPGTLPASPAWVAERYSNRVTIKPFGWIGPEALDITDLDGFKAFVASL